MRTLVPRRAWPTRSGSLAGGDRGSLPWAVGPQDRERGDDACEHEGSADPEGQVVAAREGGGARLAVGGEVLAAGGRQRRQDGEAERAANLGGRVDEAGGEAGVARRRG